MFWTLFTYWLFTCLGATVGFLICAMLTMNAEYDERAEQDRRAADRLFPSADYGARRSARKSGASFR